MEQLLQVVVILASLTPFYVSALTCYSCDSSKTPDCYEPFNPANREIQVMDCTAIGGTTCFKEVHEATLGSRGFVIRGCGTDKYREGCFPTIVDGVSISTCGCRYNLCNGHSRTSIGTLDSETTTRRNSVGSSSAGISGVTLLVSGLFLTGAAAVVQRI